MKSRCRAHFQGFERLESRIAPAVTIVNALTATYTDVDGDHVTIKFSSGTLTAGLFATAAAGLGDQLQSINLSGGGFDGASITLSVAKVHGGDGLAAVGRINAGLHDLGNVVLRGDLGGITCGDSNALTGPGLKLLSVRSIGAYGTATQGAGGDLFSAVGGSIGALKVSGDIRDASFGARNFGDRPDGRIGSMTIGGSLIGHDTLTGFLFSTGDIGPVKIAGDIVAGIGDDSGEINSGAKLGAVTVGGSLLGGTGDNSGRIFSSGDMGAVRIGGDVHGGLGAISGAIRGSANIAGATIGGSLIGGVGSDSGEVFVTGASAIGPIKIAGDMVGGGGSQSGSILGFIIGSVTVGGSVIGGPSRFSGSIFGGSKLLGPVKIGGDVIGGSDGDTGLIGANNGVGSVTIGGSVIGGVDNGSGGISAGSDMGAVNIGRNLVGGSISGSTPDLAFSGYIQSSGRIASVTIGGSVISGFDNSTGGDVFVDGSIRAGDDIGFLTVKGSLVGNMTGDGASPVVISARGQAVPGATTDLAIGKVTIGGRVEFAKILAGYNNILSASNGDASIGAVKVAGDWIASSLVAGVKNTASGNVIFGNANDASIGAGNPALIARIASIVIGGHLVGSPDSISSTDHFGFVAQQIGSFKAGGFSAVLHSVALPLDVIELSSITDDVTIREV